MIENWDVFSRVDLLIGKKCSLERLRHELLLETVRLLRVGLGLGLGLGLALQGKRAHDLVLFSCLFVHTYLPTYLRTVGL